MSQERGFFNDLFGTIGRNSGLSRSPAGISFIPDGSGGETIDIKGDSVKWLGLANPLQQKYAYDYCYPLASVVDKLAEYDIAAKIRCVRKSGKGKKEDATSPYANRLMARLKQPNPLQTWEQFRGQQTVYKRIHGFCPVLPLLASGFEHDPSSVSSMINIPPWCFDVDPTGQIIGTTELGELIRKYVITILGKTIEVNSNEVIILEDSFMQNPEKGFLLPQSKLVGLDMAISNICSAMEANNVLLKKKGPLGFISHDAAAAKDSIAGYIPMTPGEKKEMQAELSKYGLSWQQFQYVVSRVPAKWNPMSYNVTELGIDATIIRGEKAICSRFNYAYPLYAQPEGFFGGGVVDNAQSDLYESNIMPNLRKDLKKYEKFFKTDDNNCELEGDFSEVSCLQEDKLDKNLSDAKLVEVLSKEYDQDIITKNQWLEQRGYEKVADGDKYKSEYGTNDQEVDPNKKKNETIA